MTRHAIRNIAFILLALPSLAFGAGNIGGEGPLLAIHAESLAGPDSASLSGSWTFAAGVKMRKGARFLKLNLGAFLSYTPGQILIANTSYAATGFGGELVAGCAFIPVAKGPILPMLEGNLTLGGNLLRIGTPPPGTDSGTLGLTYGVQLVFGVQFKLFDQPWQAGVIYSVKQASQLANISPFSLNSLAFELGWMF